MPTFCRHSRLVQNCPICAREQNIELRPVVSSSAPKSSLQRPAGDSAPRSRTSGPGRPRATPGLTVRRLERGADDGYQSQLVPGLKSSADAERLAEELAFAAARLARLATKPPGLFAEVADGGIDIEERNWLALQIAYLGPLEGDHPFEAIERGRTTWQSGEVLSPDELELELGPRSSHEPGRGTRTLDAYRAWAERAGSQAAAFTGDAGWTPERRFARVFERLSLPGLHRGARFDLLASLGRLGVFELSGSSLFPSGTDEVTIAAKRLLGIGDPMLLDRRAVDLAAACGLPIEALDVGFYNWERGSRAALGMEPSLEPEPSALAAAQAALGL